MRRVATWNLDWWHRHEARSSQWSLIAESQTDVVLLQEVGGGIVGELRAACEGPSVFSQELHPDANLRMMGCAVLLPCGGELHAAGLIDGLPKKPLRGLWARLLLPGGQALTAVSWHALNAAGDRRAPKMAAYAAVHRWLAEEAAWPLVVGADLNTWVDPVDLQPPDPQEAFYEESDFIGPTARHGLVDAYRQVLAGRGELDRLREVRPEGPLAVSHVLQGGAGHRMDRILVSPDLTVLDAAYQYDEAVEAGSDHALHWADLAMPS